MDSENAEQQKQPESAEEGDYGQTPLARSIRSVKPLELIIPTPDILDGSDEEMVANAPHSVLRSRPTNKYQCRVLCMLKTQ